jgi:hypothetical protein
MTEISKVQIIPPSKTGSAQAAGARARSGEVRDLVVSHTAGGDAFARRSLFAHAGGATAGAGQVVSAAFLAQHLDQELIHRSSTPDTNLAASSYVRAAAAAAKQSDFALLA